MSLTDRDLSCEYIIVHYAFWSTWILVINSLAQMVRSIKYEMKT